jgi:hypothetical protein
MGGHRCVPATSDPAEWSKGHALFAALQDTAQSAHCENLPEWINQQA